jgi:hypothetical protein
MSNAPGWACVQESGPIMTHQLGLTDLFSTGILHAFPELPNYNNCLVQTSNGANIFIWIKTGVSILPVIARIPRPYFSPDANLL